MVCEATEETMRQSTPGSPIRAVPAIGVRLATFIHSQFSANTKQYGKHPATACRHTRKASRSSRHKMGSRQSAERNTSIGLAGGWTHQQRRERRVWLQVRQEGRNETGLQRR